VRLNDVDFGGDCEVEGVGVVGEGDGNGTRDICGEVTEVFEDALVGVLGRDGCFIALRSGGTSEDDIFLYVGSESR
jgi:hypothetical protein